MQLKMDVKSLDDGYVVKAVMPGVKKDDIQITVEGNQVTIAGEVKKESEEQEGERVIRSERYYGKVARTFVLPQEIDESAVSAQYADGVLDLVLPRKEKARDGRSGRREPRGRARSVLATRRSRRVRHDLLRVGRMRARNAPSSRMRMRLCWTSSSPSSWNRENIRLIVSSLSPR